VTGLDPKVVEELVNYKPSSSKSKLFFTTKTFIGSIEDSDSDTNSDTETQKTQKTTESDKP
jgi:hypothetical protein